MLHRAASALAASTRRAREYCAGIVVNIAKLPELLCKKV
jgi:hypothetical protein